jgi:hypothetical protein
LKLIGTKLYDRISKSLLGVYSIFTLFWLSTSDLFEIDYICIQIDLIFLAIFLAEILLKTFAIGFKYLCDFWNMFDIIVVLSSFVLNIMGIIVKVNTIEY